jgi:hypothetical protein
MPATPFAAVGYIRISIFSLLYMYHRSINTRTPSMLMALPQEVLCLLPGLELVGEVETWGGMSV